MNSDQDQSDEEISVSIPIRTSFIAVNDYLNKKFVGETIGRTNSNGKEVDYFKVLDIDIAKSDIEKYNIELKVKLETLTTIYNKHELQISIQASVKMDFDTQKIYVDTYKIDSTGGNWVVNKLLDSIVNTFIYQKIIKKLNIELLPLINEKLIELNAKLASRIEVKSGISVLGSLDNLTITHFKVKEKYIWTLININGWGLIDIEDLDL